MTSSLSRRKFLALGGAGAAVAAAGAAGAAKLLLDGDGDGQTATAAAVEKKTRWTDTGTWGGAEPGEGDVVTITNSVTLDKDVRVAGLVIAPGAELIFDPETNRTLTSSGNIIVRGRLVMKPVSPSVNHLITFVDVDETKFVGGGMDVVDTDTGLWVRDAGVLDIGGAAKLPWTRVAGAVEKGATTIELNEDPAGWNPGDELVITPTVSPATPKHYLAYSYAKVASITGRTVTLSAPAQHPHPAVPVGGGAPFTAEVLNMTRNVRIEGTPEGRAHIWIRGSEPQHVTYAALRHLGPRKKEDGAKFTEGVLGRYALHLHHSLDGSRGSRFEGMVARECGNHVYVAHVSHGCSFTQCISHDTIEDPFWWDLDKEGPSTEDVLWDRCVASLVKADPEHRGFTLAGFTHGRGENNSATNCVAVGVQGNNRSSGLKWPALPKEGVWNFGDAVTHNNKVDGLFVWQNTDRLHVIDRLVSYHNGGSGIEQGAYGASYHYRDARLYGNKRAGVTLHAFGKGPGIRFERVAIEGAGLTQYGFIAEPSPASGAPAEVIDCEITGITGPAFTATARAGTVEERFAVQA